MIAKRLHAPALHFLLLGGLLYGGDIYYKIRVSPPNEPVAVTLPRNQLEQAKQEFLRANGRLPSEEEQRTLYEALLDDEVLYRYAVQLGLNSQPVVERRLAQIAAFVEENQDEPKSQQELAFQATKIGLQDGDLVVRRIMIDSARRLIRAAMLVRLPDDDMLQAYLKDNPTLFQRPAGIRLTQITFNMLAHGENTAKKAKQVLEELQKKTVAPEQAAGFGDDFWIQSSLPLSTDQELIRDFDYAFVAALKDLPLHTWSGPVPSRYGFHLVMIHERRSPYTPALAEIRKQVRHNLLEKLADEWLALRLQQLKQEFKVVL